MQGSYSYSYNFDDRFSMIEDLKIWSLFLFTLLVGHHALLGRLVTPPPPPKLTQFTVVSCHRRHLLLTAARLKYPPPYLPLPRPAIQLYQLFPAVSVC